MFAELLKSAVELLKIAPRYFVAVALVSGFLLFAPDGWLESLGLSSFVSDNKKWLGMALLVSSVLWGVYVVSAVGKLIGIRFKKSKHERRVIEKLRSLTEDEKQILRYYVANNTRANTLRVDDGVVQGLVASRIIFRSASMGSILEGFAHNISELAWTYVHAYPELLDGTTNFYRTDKRDRGW